MSSAEETAARIYSQIDPLYLAMTKLRRRKFQQTVDICSSILDQNPYDQAVWYLKCRALTNINYVDDTEMEEGMFSW